MFKKISFFYFFYFAIIGIYTIFLPKMLYMYNYQAFEIGIIFATVPLMRFIVPFAFLKHFSLDQNTFKFGLFLALLSVALFYLTIQNIWAFIFANVIFGVAITLILPYIETISLRILRKQNFGKARLYGSLGFICTSLILGKLLTTPEVGLHLFFICVTCMAIFAYPFSKSHLGRNKKSTQKGGLDFGSNLGFWINIFFVQMSFGAFYNFFTIYQTDYGVSLEMISWMWIFGVVCEVIFFQLQGVIFKRYSAGALVAFASFTTAVRWFILYMYPSSVAFVFFTQSLHAIGFALYYTSAFVFLQDAYASNRQLASQFYYGIAYGLGAFFGALIAGWWYGEHLYLIASIMAFVGFVSLLTLSKDKFRKV